MNRCEIYTTFKDVQMILKRFFDISTGFRFSKISVECSVHLCSCPCLILLGRVGLLLIAISNIKGITQESPIVFSSQSVVTCPALPCSRKHPSFSSKLNWAEIQTILSTFLGVTQEAPMGDSWVIPSVTSLTDRSVVISIWLQRRIWKKIRQHQVHIILKN